MKNITMGKINRNAAIWGTGALIIFLFSLFLFTACDNLLKPKNWHFDDSQADVHITIGGNARTILPSQFEIDRFFYVFTFTRIGYDTVTLRLNETTSGTVHLALGDWNMDVWGYVTDPGETPNTALALVWATQTITVASGNNKVTVQLSLNEGNMTQTGSGTLRYEITLPTGAEGTLEVYRVSVIGGVLNQSAEAALAEDLQEGLNEGEKPELPSGFYAIHARVILDDFGATWRELAHIYDGAVTVAEKTFEASDIKNPLSGLITDFSFVGIAEIPIIDDNTIYISVPVDTNRANLTAQITHNGILITPSPHMVTDFSNPVVFTVHAAGIENSYTIHAVIIADLNDKKNDAVNAKDDVVIAISGGDVPRGDPWVYAAEMDALESAIDAAALLLFNLGSQNHINSAIEALNSTIIPFVNNPKLGTGNPDMTELSAEIARAITERAPVRVNSQASNVSSVASWVTDAEMAAFNEVITAAEQVRNNASTVTRAEVDSAITALDDAITIFRGVKKDGSSTILGINHGGVRIIDLPYPNGTELMLGILKTVENVDLAADLIANNENVQNGVVNITLRQNNELWTGESSWYVGFIAVNDSDGILEWWVSKNTIDFTDNPFPSIQFIPENFTKRDIFPATLGSLAGGADNFEQHFEDSTTMDAYLQRIWGTPSWEQYEQMILQMGMIISKTSDLTTPFEQNDMVNAGTWLYTNYPFWFFFNTQGEKIGEMVGTISLTSIPPDIRGVHIFAIGRVVGSEDFGSRGIFSDWIERESLVESPVTWSMPIYENSFGDDFDPRGFDWEFTFVVSVIHQSNKIYQVPVNNVTKSFSFSSPQPVNVGALGTVSLAYVTLSGTIDISYYNVLDLWLVFSEAGGIDYYLPDLGFAHTGTTNSWEMLVPVFNQPRDIQIRIIGFPQNQQNNGDNYLFDFIYPLLINISANQNEIKEIHLDVGNLAPNTLKVLNPPGGTYSVYVSEWDISPYSVEDVINNGGDYNIYSGSGNGSSINLNPGKPPHEYQRQFSVLIANGTERRYINNVSFKNGTGLVDWGSMTPVPYVTLSGTISVSHYDDPVSALSIRLRAWGDNPFGYLNISTQVTPTGTTNIPWTMDIPVNTTVWGEATLHVEGSTQNQLPFSVSFLPLDADKVPTNASVSDIVIEAINLVTLGGTIDVSYNGAPVPRLQIGHANIVPDGHTSTWSMVTTATNESWVIRSLAINGLSQDNNSLFHFPDYPTGEFVITIGQGKTDIHLDIGDIMPNTLIIANLPSSGTGSYRVEIVEHSHFGDPPVVVHTDDTGSGPFFNLPQGIFKENDYSYSAEIQRLPGGESRDMPIGTSSYSGVGFGVWRDW